MAGHTQARRLVEAAGRDAGRARIARFPEQARATPRAEPAPRAAVAGGAVEPAQAVVTDDDQVVGARRRRRQHMPRPAPALVAMAQHHVTQRAANLVAHGPAQTAARRPAGAAH